jgi:LmbE family N-acetylglucosaminyl deacetylase
MMMHLFLSPHPDDAVLSCGGLIHHLTEKGEAVTILTVMAGDPPDPLPDTPLVKELHQRWKVGENPVAVRRREDEAAASVLGATVEFLSIPDCVYRTAGGVGLYPVGDDDLFGDIHPDDPARAQLQQTPIPYATDVMRVYVPLGVGNHVDHQLALHWALDKLADSLDKLTFYEEYPYGEQPAAIQQARDNFPHPLTAQTSPLSEANFDAKCTAIAAHQSQISTFWGGLDEMRRRVQATMLHVGDGQLAERVWIIEPRKHEK